MSTPTGKKTAYQMQNIIAQALKADTALTTLCTASFGKAQNVYSGFDPKSPPARTSLPWIVVNLASIGVNAEFVAPEYSFFVGGAAEISPDTTTISSVATVTDLDKAYKFAAKVHQVASDAILNTSAELGYDLVNVSSVDFETDFPFVNFYFNLTAVIEPN
jgi:hypothetical protein